jgi:trk system potassium uptake protein TrkH
MDARASKKVLKPARIVALTLALSVISLLAEGRLPALPARGIDLAIALLLTGELLVMSRRCRQRQTLLRCLLLAVCLGLFCYDLALVLTRGVTLYGRAPLKLIVLRNSYTLLAVFGRLRRFNLFVKSFTAQPARTVMFSFLLAILTGTLVLMLPFTAAEGRGLGFIDSLFTATSAVCVTGLIVVDTATAFSLWGKLVLMLLIQAGGLGIMILSFFVIFTLRRSFSLEDKLLISYMLSESDMRSLGRSIRNIIAITLAFEGAGALLLLAAFAHTTTPAGSAGFAAVFHSVSAFCNAGFSVFSDSLMSFRDSVPVNLVICLLIIAGGLSFAVIMDLGGFAANRLTRHVLKRNPPARGLSLNTRVVVIGTGLLLLAGMLLVYTLEHRNSLLPLGVGRQYLAAFFQSVTLRTAGFNTIDFSSLTTATYMVMIVFMFIGGASGSTAGGVKINSLAVILAYIRSILKDRKQATLLHYTLDKDMVLRALLILFFGIVVVSASLFVLSLTERAPFIQLAFEAMSAFGTVGLSAGVTSSLTRGGKCVIIVLMFVGRIGPLTMLAAAVRRRRSVQVEYPRGEILIG